MYRVQGVGYRVIDCLCIVLGLRILPSTAACLPEP
jgi:hypothetical protein